MGSGTNDNNRRHGDKRPQTATNSDKQRELCKALAPGAVGGGTLGTFSATSAGTSKRFPAIVGTGAMGAAGAAQAQAAVTEILATITGRRTAGTYTKLFFLLFSYFQLDFRPLLASRVRGCPRSRGSYPTSQLKDARCVPKLSGS